MPNEDLRDILEIYRLSRASDIAHFLPTGDEILRLNAENEEFDELALMYDGKNISLEYREKGPEDRFIQERLDQDLEETEETGAELAKRVLE